MLKAVHEELQPMERTHPGAVGKDYCGRDPTLEQGRSVMSPSTEGIGASETTYDELTTGPNPCHPVPQVGSM